LAAWPSVEAVIYFGRRETASYLAIAVGLILFYQRRIVPPRALLVGALLLATVVIPAIDRYRHYSRELGIAALGEIDLLGDFEKYTSNASILELRNAAFLIEATQVRGAYAFGTGYWDQIIWRFVPAQWVGQDIKRALMFNYDQTAITEELAALGYHMEVGSTVTGIGDAFVQFWYMGSLFFVALGVLVRSIFKASLHRAATFAQLLYICSVTSAMRTVTHQTADYLPGFIFNLIFIGGAVFYGALRSSAHPGRAVG